ncbi:MAG: prepilin-type N-terminal cleavage/methylation domain-containing protein [Clostridium sp.]|nr:prepilin-type N-terminal cleavage/methylation domain-containing protein [Clostridium sp.]
MKILKGNKKKKKGFTLIELIIVIAIIAILALIIIPQVLGYINNAKNSTDIADSKTLVSAIESYNAANPTATPIDLSTNANTLSTLSSFDDPSINDALTKINSADPTLYGMKIDDLENIVNKTTTVHR